MFWFMDNVTRVHSIIYFYGMASVICPVVWLNTLNDQIFVIRQIIQKCLEYNKDVHILFINFKKAYDSIYRESFINILKEFKFLKTMVNLIGASVNSTNIKVKIGNVLSQLTRVTIRLQQGNALSPVLFNLVVEKVIWEINVLGVTLGQTNYYRLFSICRWYHSSWRRFRYDWTFRK